MKTFKGKKVETPIQELLYNEQRLGKRYSLNAG